METRPFLSAGGIAGKQTTEPVPYANALETIWQGIDTGLGGLLISNYEAPNRYARWDIGFLHPPIELSCYGRHVILTALNGEGLRLLGLMEGMLKGNAHIATLTRESAQLHAHIVPNHSFFTEEERSRQPSLFSVLRAIQNVLLLQDAPGLGWCGAFGFDLVWQFEPCALRLPRDKSHADCRLFFVTSVVMVDRSKKTAMRYSYCFETPQGPSLEGEGGGLEVTQPPPGRSPDLDEHGPMSDHTEGEFRQKVERVRQGCKAGDFFEVVLSQRFSAPSKHPPSLLFKTLLQQNPSPYSFLFNFGVEQLVGASPEMYVRVTGRKVETSPISGTVPVGQSPMETAAEIKRLISSEKEESELTMCTDVDRNDMCRVCVPGSVRLIGRRLLETYSRLVHTADHVEGNLAEPYDGLDAFAVHLWACTVTGSPKPAALRFIEANENTARRWYAGAIGFLFANGDLNTGMTLRTVHIENGWAHIRAGATLLYDSKPEEEERETHIKASAFLDVVTKGKAPLKLARSPFDRTGEGKKVLLVDFMDSFVHTLAAYLRCAGAEVTTVRAEFPDAVLAQIKPDLVLLSPGPGTPDNRGVGRVIERCLAQHLPLFGVCLGHQGLAQYFGARLNTLETPMHGKQVRVQHNRQQLFTNIPHPFTAALYHSLYVCEEGLPKDLEINARSETGTIMGLRHRSLPIASFQFHPESILTLTHNAGHRLIENLFIHLVNHAKHGQHSPVKALSFS